MFRNIRFYVLATSAIYIVIIYIWVISTFAGNNLQTIRLTQIFALSALAYLYLALLIGPLTYVWYSIPFREQIHKSRRAIGVSAFFFACIHGYLAFFKQLGGFEGLGFLSSKYLIAISLSVTALFILLIMASTSFDWLIARIKYKKWKMIHRLVYIACIFTLIHAMMLGTHFADLSASIPQIFFWAFALLMFFELNRIDAFLKKFSWYPNFGLTQIIGGGLTGAFLIVTALPAGAGGTPSLGIHALHIQLAKEAQQGTSTIGSNNPALNNIPGLKGDRTRRYTISFQTPDKLVNGVDTPITFQVYDASSGNPVKLFERVYEKVVHMIVVDSQLNFFEHIHPEQTSNGFTITTKFPHDGTYHVYLDFQPLGAIEQQIAFTVIVGSAPANETATYQPDQNLTKTFGDYQVNLKFPTPLKSSDMSIGNQKLTFTLTDKNGQPVTNLKPYLAAFGHLVMINETTYDYLHVHPNNLVAPKPDQNGGPTVEFLPLGIYGPIKPGIYRAFAQFNPDNKLMTADFTVKVE